MNSAPGHVPSSTAPSVPELPVAELGMIFDIAITGGGRPEDLTSMEQMMEPTVVEVTLALPTGAHPGRKELIQSIGEAVAVCPLALACTCAWRMNVACAC